MRSPIRTAVVIFGLTTGLITSLACSGANFSMPSAELTEPWDGMNLPLDGGTVVYSDDKTLSITYDGDKVKKLAPKYAKALKKAGYKETMNIDADDSWVFAVEKDGTKVNFAISKAGAMTVVGASTD